MHNLTPCASERRWTPPPPSPTTPSFVASPPPAEGPLTSPLPLDPRLTIYPRIGDAFAVACTAVTALVAIWGIIRARQRRAAVAT